MNDRQFRKFLDLLMCCDPYPVTDDPDNHFVMTSLATSEALKRGYDDWIDAYHLHENS